MIRSILAVLLGVIIAAILIGTLESLGHVFFPPPPGVDPTTPESRKTLVEDLPPAAIVSLLVAWVAGTFVGAWIAASLARRSPLVHGLVIGGILLATAVFTMVEIPHPAWFWAVTLVLFPLASYAGGELAKPSPSSAAP